MQGKIEVDSDERHLSVQRSILGSFHLKKMSSDCRVNLRENPSTTTVFTEMCAHFNWQAFLYGTAAFCFGFPVWWLKAITNYWALDQRLVVSPCNTEREQWYNESRPSATRRDDHRACATTIQPPSGHIHSPTVTTLCLTQHLLTSTSWSSHYNSLKGPKPLF